MDTGISQKTRFWPNVDRLLRFFSLLTLGVLTAGALLPYLTALPTPPWLGAWFVTVLTSAAVGYVTNWIAIQMLFRPYGKCCGIQGVIPRERRKLGRNLGVVIPANLLKPEELADELGRLVREYLRNPELIDTLRHRVDAFLRRYSGEIANFLIPYIEEALRHAIRRNLTPENLRFLYEEVASRWLAVPANRELLAGGIVSELQNRAPEITAMIRDQVRIGTGEYIRTGYPALCRFVPADEFAMKLVDFLNWHRIQHQIAARLGEADTRETVSAELLRISGLLQDYLRTPEAAAGVEAFIAEHRRKAETFLRDYLVENLPAMADKWLHQDEFWSMAEEKLLPAVESFVSRQLEREKDTLIAKLDLPGRIEQAVGNMDARKLHEMIDEAAGEHLTLIQILGFILGGIAGALLAMVN